MNEIVVKKSRLIEIMEANRAAHRDLFLEAQKGFRELVIEKLDHMLAAARHGKDIDLYVGLTEPEDHTDDYDTVIGMLKLDINESVTLTLPQYRNWVEDEWGWSASATTTNTYYAASVGSPKKK